MITDSQPPRSAGSRFRVALAEERPLQIPGAINAFTALLVARAGFRALYLSGAGVANASLGVPDLGFLNLGDVETDVRRITAATSLPVLVDIDTGLGPPLAIPRTVHELSQLGVAGVHIEDQEEGKRCGHRQGKVIASTRTMVHRIELAVGSRVDPEFVIVARTDALAVEGREKTIDRARAYRDAGADMLFLEAARSAEDYRVVADEVGLPLLANMTEFGVTPLLGLDELADAGVAAALYPLSAFRAMSAAATATYEALRSEGTQTSVLHSMQSRTELYEILEYERAEALADRLQDGP